MVDQGGRPFLAFACNYDILASIKRPCRNQENRHIDEYDKPILDNMDQPEMAALAKEELKAFYSVIKDNDEYICFAFLNGVTKFSRVSVFFRV